MNRFSKSFLGLLCVIAVIAPVSAMQSGSIVAQAVERDIAATMARVNDTRRLLVVRLVNITRLRQLYSQSVVEHSLGQLDALEQQIRTQMAEQEALARRNAEIAAQAHNAGLLSRMFSHSAAPVAATPASASVPMTSAPTAQSRPQAAPAPEHRVTIANPEVTAVHSPAAPAGSETAPLVADGEQVTNNGGLLSVVGRQFGYIGNGLGQQLGFGATAATPAAEVNQVAPTSAPVVQPEVVPAPAVPKQALAVPQISREDALFCEEVLAREAAGREVSVADQIRFDEITERMKSATLATRAAAKLRAGWNWLANRVAPHVQYIVDGAIGGEAGPAAPAPLVSREDGIFLEKIVARLGAGEDVPADDLARAEAITQRPEQIEQAAPAPAAPTADQAAPAPTVAQVPTPAAPKVESKQTLTGPALLSAEEHTFYTRVLASKAAGRDSEISAQDQERFDELNKRMATVPTLTAALWRDAKQSVGRHIGYLLDGFKASWVAADDSVVAPASVAPSANPAVAPVSAAPAVPAGTSRVGNALSWLKTRGAHALAWFTNKPAAEEREDELFEEDQAARAGLQDGEELSLEDRAELAAPAVPAAAPTPVQAPAPTVAAAQDSAAGTGVSAEQNESSDDEAGDIETGNAHAAAADGAENAQKPGFLSRLWNSVWSSKEEAPADEQK